MATLAFAVGSSHGPTNQTPPEDWPRLCEGDKSDPCYDYNEMLAKANANIAASGLTNAEIRKGIIEDLPVEDSSVDWVISNCVINLSPEKD